MIFSAIFLISCMWAGWEAAKRISLLDCAHKRLAFALGIGVLAGTWLCFLSSWAAGRLSQGTVIFSSVLLLAVARMLSLKPVEKNDREPVDRAGAAFVAAACIGMLLLNNAVLMETNNAGDMTVAGNAWSDYPLHFAIIASFTERGNFPPEYPLLLGAPMGYPFIIEFLTAITVKGGIGLRESILLTHLMFYFVLASFGYFLAKEAANSKAAGIFAVTLFLVNGNAGIFKFAQDALSSGNALEFISHLPRAYSHIGEHGIEFMNLTFSVFIPQRSAIMGFALSLLLYYLLFRLLKKRGNAGLLAAGTAYGLLPLAHGHFFIAASVVVGAWGIWLLAQSSDKPRQLLELMWFAVPALALALPQVLWISRQVGANPDFFSMQTGWLDANRNYGIPQLAIFWLANAWLAIPLALVGLAMAAKGTRWLYAPFAAIFILGNTIKFQPWDWDTIKVLAHWFFATCVFAAIPIAALWDSRRKAFQAAAIAILLACTATGWLSLAWWQSDDPVLYTSRELQAAEWIRSNTDPEAVWLTSDAHTHAVYTLAGRRVVLGLHSFLNNHGLKYGEQERDVDEFFTKADCAVALKYGAKYAFVGPQEDYIEHANRDAFRANPGFEKIKGLEMPGGLAEVYRISC